MNADLPTFSRNYNLYEQYGYMKSASQNSNLDGETSTPLRASWSASQFDSIPQIFDDYRKDEQFAEENYMGPWFPIPLKKFKDDEKDVENLKNQLVELAPNYSQFMYEFLRVYSQEEPQREEYENYQPSSSTKNVMIVDLISKKHSKLSFEKLHALGTRLNCRVRSYTHIHETLSPPRVGFQRPSMFKFWVDISNPSFFQLELLERSFGVHHLTTEDIMTPTTREKEEEYPNYLFIVLKEIDPVIGDSEPYQSRNVYIIVFPWIIFTIHMTPFSTLPLVLYEILYFTENMELSVAWVLYKILDANVKDLVSIVDYIQDRVVSLDSSIDKHRNNVLNRKSIFTRRISFTRQFITRLRGDFFNKREVISYLVAENAPRYIDSPLKVFFRDVYDNVRLLIDRLEGEYELLSNANHKYLAIVSLEQSTMNHRIMEVMKCFGIITVIIFPLSVITGLWGMNVQVPMGIEFIENLDFFYIIVIGFAIWAVVALIFFKLYKCI